MDSTFTDQHRLQVSEHTGRYIVQQFNWVYCYWSTIAIIPDEQGEAIRERFLLGDEFSLLDVADIFQPEKDHG